MRAPSVFGSITRWHAVACGAVVILSACTKGDEGMRRPDASFSVDGALDAGPADADFPDPTVDPCTAESMGSTLGQACASGSECADGCFCNGVEQCVDGVCEAGADPCTDDVSCTEEVCLEETDQCFFEPRHEMCADEDACNGREVCDPTLGCRPASPLYCNDESACTIDSCDTVEGCVYTLRDLDGDGYVDGRCGGDDCDDDPRFGTEIYPGATEICDNRRDDDCDGLRDFNDSSDCSPTNDTCSDATLLAGAGTYSGSTVGLADDHSLDCGGAGPDSVFRIELTEMQDLRVAVSGGGSGVTVALRPWAACASGPDEECSDSSAPLILRRSLAAGEYAIIVKTSSGSPFDLTVTLGPPTPVPPVDVCDATTEDVSAGGTFTGLFVEVEDDYSLSCNTRGASKDAAYQFTLTEEKDVLLSASTSGGSWSSTAYLTLTTDCSDPLTELLCRSGSTAEVLRRGLTAGTYYVLIEPSSDDAGSWNLDVTITDPAPRAVGDACSTAVDITSAEGSASLATSELDVGTTCGGTSSSYRDLFYYFDLTATQDVTLTTDAGGSTHYVALETECGRPATELRCRRDTSPTSQTFRSLPPGRYYVVMSTIRSSGTATASITTGPPTPVPANDRCAGAIEVGGGYNERDTLVGYEDDVAGCRGSGYPDAFYRLTLAARKRVIISAAPVDTTDRIYLTLRDACTSSTDLACDDDTGSAGITQILDAGTYYLTVEMSASDEGPYDLDVFLVDP